MIISKIFIFTIIGFMFIILPVSGDTQIIDFFIKNGYNKVASKIMSQEIIRQLKEKEGMTIKEYYKKLFEKGKLK